MGRKTERRERIFMMESQRGVELSCSVEDRSERELKERGSFIRGGLAG